MAGTWGSNSGLMGTIPETEEQKQLRLKNNTTKYTNNFGQPIAFTPSAPDGRGGGTQGYGERFTKAGASSAQSGAGSLDQSNVSGGRAFAPTSQQLALQKAFSDIYNKSNSISKNIKESTPYSLKGYSGENRDLISDTSLFKNVDLSSAYTPLLIKLMGGVADKEVKNYLEEALTSVLNKRIDNEIGLINPLLTEYNNNITKLENDRASLSNPSYSDIDLSQLTDSQRASVEKEKAYERAIGSLGIESDTDLALKNLRELYAGKEQERDALKESYTKEVSDFLSQYSPEIDSLISMVKGNANKYNTFSKQLENMSNEEFFKKYNPPTETIGGRTLMKIPIKEYKANLVQDKIKQDEDRLKEILSSLFSLDNASAYSSFDRALNSLSNISKGVIDKYGN